MCNNLLHKFLVRVGWAADTLPRCANVAALEKHLTAQAGDCLFAQYPKGFVRRFFVELSKYTRPGIRAHRMENDAPDAKKAEAKAQAIRYAGGELAGFELDRERYLVLSAKTEFDKPKDEIVDQIAYRVATIFLTRPSPSIAARRTPQG